RNRGSPCFDTNTGSTTRFGTLIFSIAAATASMISADESMPVFAASAPMSPTTERICAPTTSAGTSAAAVTPSVFCTVTDVTAEVPHTPSAANVFRSAWIPAPPPESDPAMVSARGTSSPCKVIPSPRLERSLLTVGPGRGEARTLPDLPDVGEPGPEPLPQRGRRGVDRVRRQRGDELEVLP